MKEAAQKVDAIGREQVTRHVVTPTHYRLESLLNVVLLERRHSHHHRVEQASHGP